MHGKTRCARRGQQLLLRCRGELVAPLIALGAPQQIRLRRMAHDDHGVDTRWRGDERRSNRRSNSTRFGGAETAQAFECAADATHNVRTFERDFIGHHAFGALKDACRVCRRKTQGLECLRHGAHGLLGRHIAVQSGIGVRLLEGYDLRVAIAAVGGDDHPSTRIVDAIRQRLVAETAEHRRIDDAKTLAGLGPVHLLGDVRHVDRDAITRLQPKIAQCERAARHFEQQLLARHRIRDHRSAATTVLRLIPTIAFKPQRSLGAVSVENVAVYFIETGVGECATEPTVKGRLAGIEGGMPRPVLRRQCRLHRLQSSGIEAAPHTRRRLETDPCTVLADTRLEPVEFATGDVAVIGTRIELASSASGVPG